MDPIIIQGIQISILGILVVFCALGLVMLLLFGFELFKPLLLRLEGSHESSGHDAKAAQAEESIPTDVLIAIVAAVEAVLGDGVKVQRVRYLKDPPARSWATQGRVTIMGSRAVRSIRP